MGSGCSGNKVDTEISLGWRPGNWEGPYFDRDNEKARKSGKFKTQAYVRTHGITGLEGFYGERKQWEKLKSGFESE